MPERHVETIEHDIGATGLVTVDIIDGSVRVIGADGEEARLIVRSPEGDDAIGIAKIHRQAGELRVDVRGMSPGGGVRGLVRRDLPSIDLDVTVPRSARLHVNSVSADVHVSGVHGDQRHRTVSGDLDALGVEGNFIVQAVSGDVRVEGGSYSIETVTTSGDVEIRATRLLATQLRSVSGDVELAGEFAAQASHRVETVSGDLRIAPVGGLTVSARGLSTSIHSQLPHRSESRAGRRTVVIGDGRADLDFRSMSGDVSVIDGTSEHGRSGDRPAGSSPLSPAVALPPRDELSILRALERGDIDIDEATRLLEENDHG